MPELFAYIDVIDIAENVDSFEKCIKKRLDYLTQESAQHLIHFSQANTWIKRVEQLCEIIKKELI